MHPTTAMTKALEAWGCTLKGNKLYSPDGRLLKFEWSPVPVEGSETQKFVPLGDGNDAERELAQVVLTEVFKAITA